MRAAGVETRSDSVFGCGDSWRVEVMSNRIPWPATQPTPLSEPEVPTPELIRVMFWFYLCKIKRANQKHI